MDQVKKADRRIRKTKQTIQEAFFDLLEESSAEHITVSQLCARANINRNTFYYHYGAVLDLLNEIIDNFAQDMEAIYQEDIPTQQKCTEVCRLFSMNHRLVNLLSDDYANTVFMRRLEPLVSKYICANLRCSGSKFPAQYYEIAASYVCYGALMAVAKWICHGMKETPEEMGAFLAKIISEGFI